MRCQWCECELSEPEVYCPDCIEMLNETLDLMLSQEDTNERAGDNT
jgi:hypothetical protein